MQTVLYGVVLSTQPYGNALDEWKEARSILARFDNNLHDLRKYGFSFVTALLAANGLISIGGTSSAQVPDQVKASILVATMGLIVTLKLLDRHYLSFERAASLRCRLLEDRLNLELTGDIAFFYDLDYWWVPIMLLYLGFVVLTTILGYAILTYAVASSQMFLFNYILAAAIISAAFIIGVDLISGVKKNLQDWTVDLKIVSKGSPLRITFTNLHKGESKKPGTFILWWKVKPLQVKNPKEPLEETLPKVAKLRYFENYIWLWETAQVEPGLYEFEMFATRRITPELMAMTKDKEIDESRVREQFVQVMSKDEGAPCKWIIQVTSAPKQTESGTSFLAKLKLQ